MRVSKSSGRRQTGRGVKVGARSVRDGISCNQSLRFAGLERDLTALQGQSDVEALKAALEEFDGVWGSLDLSERARLLALVLDEVVVDGATGDAELRFRGAHDNRPGAVPI
jgi:hypothetical protein